MKIIVGLGNPGRKYEATRHNAGFMAVDFYLKDKEAIKCESKFRGYTCEMHFATQKLTPSVSPLSGGEAPQESKDSRGAPPPEKEGLGEVSSVKVFFIKPQTYMNNSGEAVAEIANFYKVNVEKDLLVIHDEIDLPLGTYKLVFNSRAAGHNGVQSIIDSLGTQKFHRLRIGVESRASRNEIATDEFVLQNFTDEQYKQLSKNILPKVNEEIEKFITL